MRALARCYTGFVAYVIALVGECMQVFTGQESRYQQHPVWMAADSGFLPRAAQHTVGGQLPARWRLGQTAGGGEGTPLQL